MKKYIAEQVEHHKQEDFKSELLRIPRAHGVEFDEQYVFDCPAPVFPALQSAGL